MLISDLLTSVQSTMNLFTENLLRDTGVLVPGLAATLDPTLDIEPTDPDLVPPPWSVLSRSALELAQFPVEAVQPYIPADLQIVQTWPGHTLGLTLFVSYEQTPVGAYNEFILAPALVKYRDALSLWVVEIDVDSERSRKNGRFNWGLPKQLRSFLYTWADDRASLKVLGDAASTLVDASYSHTSLPSLDLPDWLPQLSLLTYRGGLFQHTPAQVLGKATPASFRIAVDAPGTCYDLISQRQPLLGLSFNPARLVLDSPQPIAPVVASVS